VLFPGLVLPLHIFEERYRTLVRDLTERDEDDREFGVVAIARGWETEDGSDADQPSPPVLHEIGCSAQLQKVTALPDGRYDTVSVGRRRFSIISVDDTTAPYLTAEVEWLTEPESPPGELDRLVPGALERFQRYLRMLRPDTAGEQLPDDATVLSHLIAATMVLDLAERQTLLAADGAAARLRAERRLLARELVLLEEIRAVPVTPAEFSVSTSPN
jgi:Lon protease-like protein